MNEPPEPPPKLEGTPDGDASYFRGIRCPNCGEPNAEAAPYCRKCGWDLRRRSGGPNVGLILLFVFIGIPGLCLGGCFVYFGAGTIGPRGEGLPFVGVGLIGLAIFALTLYFAFLRKRK